MFGNRSDHLNDLDAEAGRRLTRESDDVSGKVIKRAEDAVNSLDEMVHLLESLLARQTSQTSPQR